MRESTLLFQIRIHSSITLFMNHKSPWCTYTSSATETWRYVCAVITWNRARQLCNTRMHPSSFRDDDHERAILAAKTASLWIRLETPETLVHDDFAVSIAITQISHRAWSSWWPKRNGLNMNINQGKIRPVPFLFQPVKRIFSKTPSRITRTVEYKQDFSGQSWINWYGVLLRLGLACIQASCK